MKHILSKVTVILFTALLISSCKYAEITDFVHVPTQNLPEKPDLTSSELDLYRCDNLVCAPRVTHLDHHTSKIDLLLYSESPANNEIQIMTAVLRDSFSKRIAEMRRERSVLMQPDSVNEGVFVGGVVLMEKVKDSALKDAAKLELALMLSSGREQKEIVFHLDQRVRRYHVQR